MRPSPSGESLTVIGAVLPFATPFVKRVRSRVTLVGNKSRLGCSELHTYGVVSPRGWRRFAHLRRNG
jgi:hypothetical protein